MFSLVITLVSIALVAALALATMYFGGSAFTKGQKSAQAAEVINQSQQILGAMEMFKVERGRYPGQAGLDGITELVNEGYLRAAPIPTVAQAGALPTAYAADATWTIPVAGVPTAVISSSVELELCKEVNLKARGDNGILAKAYAAYVTQCYGPNAGVLTVVVSKASEGLAQAVGAGNYVDSATSPSGPSTSGAADGDGVWLSAPTSSSNSSNGGAGNGGSGGTPTDPPETGGPANIAFSVSNLVLSGSTNAGFGNFTITNNGTSTVDLTPTFGRPDAFQYIRAGCTAPLAAGETCTFVVRFLASGQTSTQTDTLTIAGHSLTVTGEVVNQFIVVEATTEAISVRAAPSCPTNGPYGILTPPPGQPVYLSQSSQDAAYSVDGQEFGALGSPTNFSFFCIPSDPQDAANATRSIKRYAVNVPNQVSPHYGNPIQGFSYLPNAGVAAPVAAVNASDSGSMTFTAKGVTYTASIYGFTFNHSRNLNGGVYSGSATSTDFAAVLHRGVPAQVGTISGIVTLSP